MVGVGWEEGGTAAGARGAGSQASEIRESGCTPLRSWARRPRLWILSLLPRPPPPPFNQRTGENSTVRTTFLCTNSCTVVERLYAPAPLSTGSSAHTRAEASPEPVAARRPEASNFADHTAPLWPSSLCSQLPVAASRTIAVLSCAAVMKEQPSGSALGEVVGEKRGSAGEAKKRGGPWEGGRRRPRSPVLNAISQTPIV